MSDQIPEATNNTGDSDYNSSVSEISESPELTYTDSGESQESGQTGGNPAWEEALSAIPQEFHPHLKEHFGKWDGGIQKRFQTVQQQYAPLKQYEEFANLGVAPTDINEAMQIRHAMQNDPASLYKWLETSYNLGQQGQGQEEIQELELSETDAFFQDPRYTELKQKAEFAEQAIRQFNQQAVTSKVSAQVETETRSVQEKFPGLNIAEVATFALGMAQNDNSMPDLMKAAERMAGFVPNASPAVPRASDSAPPVISGNRGLPTTSINYGTMNSDDRSKLVADLMRAAQQE
jgi:hypothetical protein